MIRIRDISLAPEHEAGALLYEAAKAMGVSASEIQKLTIVRRSIDARKKPEVKVIYTVDAQKVPEQAVECGPCERLPGAEGTA